VPVWPGQRCRGATTEGCRGLQAPVSPSLFPVAERRSTRGARMGRGRRRLRTSLRDEDAFGGPFFRGLKPPATFAGSLRDQEATDGHPVTTLPEPPPATAPPGEGTGPIRYATGRVPPRGDVWSAIRAIRTNAPRRPREERPTRGRPPRPSEPGLGPPAVTAPGRHLKSDGGAAISRSVRFGSVRNARARGIAEFRSTHGNRGYLRHGAKG
jgi:hypothetical protein